MDEELPYSDELLVELVHARENLFDKGRVDYKDEQAKAEAWDAIACAFGMRVEECQTRWVRLRERFGRELRLHKRGVPPGKEWPLFARMRWLERFIQPRNRVGTAKAHVAAMQAALARERGLGLGLGGLAGSASNSGDGHGVAVSGGEEATSSSPPSSTAGPSAAAPPSGSLWSHTFKLWGEHHLNHHHGLEEDNMDDTQQDMAVDLAKHASSTPQPAGTSSSGRDYHHHHHHHHGLAGDTPPLAGGMLPSPRGEAGGAGEADFQDSVRQAVASMAGSLDSIERHLARAPLDAHDPDELFARSLAATLRRLPRHRRSQAKMKLIAVLAEFEDGGGP